MEFTGRVSLREIEKKTFEVSGKSLDPWVQNMLRKAAPAEALCGLNSREWAEQSKFETQLRVEKIGQEYLITGKLTAAVKSPCSRCGDGFEAPRVAVFRLVMHKTTHDENPDGEDSGDPDYIFFDADEIDLTEILAEQLIVLEPVAECPEKDSSGKCLLCGENPQFDKTAGQGLESRAFSPFSDLQTLKKGD